MDDKLIVRARELGTTVKELAERMTADYLDCLKKLNVTGIDQMPRATEHIAEMIEIMRGLIDKGYAYAAGGDVYFDVSKDADYGKLCNRDPGAAGGRARASRSATRSATPATSPCGRRPSPASRRGTARGARAGPAGTSNARP